MVATRSCAFGNDNSTPYLGAWIINGNRFWRHIKLWQRQNSYSNNNRVELLGGEEVEISTLGIRNFNLWKSKVKKKGKIGLNLSLIHIHTPLSPTRAPIFFPPLQLRSQKKFLIRKIMGRRSPQPQVLRKFLLEFNENIYSATVGLGGFVLYTHIH